jgi:tetratricopeptide (TPR) repeat protein
MLKEAQAWFEGQELTETLALEQDRVRRALFGTYCRLAEAHLERHDYQAARELLAEALTMERLTWDRRDVLLEFLERAVAEQMGGILVQASQALDRGHEGQAVLSLTQANEIFREIPPVVAERQEEMVRRLWWGWTKVGMLRLDGGRFSEAREALRVALAIPVDGERGERTRRLLMDAYAREIEGRTRRAVQLAESGDRAAAQAEADLLRALAAEGRGIDSQGEMTGLFDEMARTLERAGLTPGG